MQSINSKHLIQSRHLVSNGHWSQRSCFPQESNRCSAAHSAHIPWTRRIVTLSCPWDRGRFNAYQTHLLKFIIIYRCKVEFRSSNFHPLTGDFSECWVKTLLLRTKGTTHSKDKMVRKEILRKAAGATLQPEFLPMCSVWILRTYWQSRAHLPWKLAQGFLPRN